jgi:hypothetical protein
MATPPSGTAGGMVARLSAATKVKHKPKLAWILANRPNDEGECGSELEVEHPQRHLHKTCKERRAQRQCRSGHKFQVRFHRAGPGIYLLQCHPPNTLGRHEWNLINHRPEAFGNEGCNEVMKVKKRKGNSGVSQEPRQKLHRHAD